MPDINKTIRYLLVYSWKTILTTLEKLYTLLGLHPKRPLQNPIPQCVAISHPYCGAPAIGTNLSMHLLIHTHFDTDGLLTWIDVSEQQSVSDTSL